jgi:hypothetical protein
MFSFSTGAVDDSQLLIVCLVRLGCEENLPLESQRQGLDWTKIQYKKLQQVKT